MGFLTGAVYGGFIKSRLAYLDFMENNQATAFKSHFDAKVCTIKNYRSLGIIIIVYSRFLEKTPGLGYDKFR